MCSTELIVNTEAIDIARECLYRFLAAAVSDPRTSRWPLVQDRASRQLAMEAADLIRSEHDATGFPLVRGELPPAALDVRALVEALDDAELPVGSEYDRIFGLLVPRECPPYETEYHSNGDTFFRSQQLADVAGFYRGFGIQPSLVSPERHDHIALELEFMSFLLLKRRLAAAPGDATAAEKVEVCAAAERGFFQEHLAWWVPAFATGLGRKASTGYYAVLSQILRAFIPVERRWLDLPVPLQVASAQLIERPEEDSGCAACTP
jgi:TorA maturation chaperone TorD